MKVEEFLKKNPERDPRNYNIIALRVDVGDGMPPYAIPCLRPEAKAFLIKTLEDRVVELRARANEESARAQSPKDRSKYHLTQDAMDMAEALLDEVQNMGVCTS